MIQNYVDTRRAVTICKSSLCPSAVPSSNPLTVYCNHCVFSVIFRELASVRPLYDTVNFNCLGLSALTPVQPPEGTRELTEGAYGIEWEKATVVHLSISSGSMTAHIQLFWHYHAAINIQYFSSFSIGILYLSMSLFYSCMKTYNIDCNMVYTNTCSFVSLHYSQCQPHPPYTVHQLQILAIIFIFYFIQGWRIWINWCPIP